ncbi:hypothetical protein MCW82_01215 [Azospirillum doebereinerae]|uniref:hypothetical protein n=1 Tax=Azospirillum doebereinerae TaxID=92933 RepID=UPI001EE5446B|nr:hypothetical protein [Azospirillum doebereinerae]MCG5238402.1 hypothetical protein [Azospirillum doebereinerae]
MARGKKFGAELGRRGKTNNHPAARAAKVEVRRRVLEALGAGNAVVFDAFAGDGAMWRAVWRDAAGYVGCDLLWYRDERTAFVSDNIRVLRCLPADDLAGFTVFDLDAYGSPWEQAAIIGARRPVRRGERLGLILTEGSGLKLKMGGYPAALCALAGIRPGAAGGAKAHDELIDRALVGLCRRMGARIERRWQAQGKTGAAVRYIGLVLVGE